MVEGYALVDEYVLACALVGVVGLVIRNKLYVPTKGYKSYIGKIHFFCFSLFMLYLSLQSLRGLIVLQDFRMIRFVAVFFFLYLAGYISYKQYIPLVPPGNLIRIVLYSTLVYFLLYLGHGVYNELWYGLNRFDKQGFEWSGSTVAMFPIFPALSAVYFAIKNEPVRASVDIRPPKWLAWAVIITSIVAGFYYDSRISMLAVIGFFLLSFRSFGLIKSAIVAVVFLGAFYAIYLITVPGADSYTMLTEFFENLFVAGAGKQASDMDRKLAVVAAFRSILTDFGNLFVGTGFYVDRFSMLPFYTEVLYERGVIVGTSDIVRTATFPSLLAGTGLIGIFLLLSCYFCTAYEIFRQSRILGHRAGKVLVLSLGLVFISMFISISVDLILFYMCLMPNGLLIQLSRYGKIA